MRYLRHATAALLTGFAVHATADVVNYDIDAGASALSVRVGAMSTAPAALTGTVVASTALGSATLGGGKASLAGATSLQQTVTQPITTVYDAGSSQIDLSFQGQVEADYANLAFDFSSGALTSGMDRSAVTLAPLSGDITTRLVGAGVASGTFNALPFSIAFSIEGVATADWSAAAPQALQAGAPIVLEEDRSISMAFVSQAYGTTPALFELSIESNVPLFDALVPLVLPFLDLLAHAAMDPYFRPGFEGTLVASNPAAVPEPATWVLFTSAGTAFLLSHLRRRRRS